MALKAKPVRFRCTVCGYTSHSEQGIKLHITAKEDEEHADLDPTEANITSESIEPRSLPQIIREDFGGCERVERIVEDTHKSPDALWNELKDCMWQSNVELFTHGEYRMVRVTDSDQ